MIQLVDLLNTFGAWLFRSMVRLSLELAVLAAVVLAVIYVLKVRSPRLRHLFWCLVLAKPVVTFLIASPISLYWFLHPAKIALPQPASLVAVVRPVEADYGPRTMAYRPMPRAVSMPEPAPMPPWWAGMRADGVVAVGWLMGAMLLALRLLFGFAFVSFLRRTAVPQDDGPLAETAERARRTLGLRGRTIVALSPAVHGPVLAGVLRPAVLLPGRMMEQCTPQQIEMVVAHELAHARRMDNLALLVQRLAEVVLFFHPVVWLCGWIMRRESESACDYAVIEAYSAAARADQSALYAESLTRVAEMRSGITRRLLINTFAAAESNLAGRVRRIIEGRLTRRTLTWTLASVGALVAVAFVGLPTAAGPKDKAQKTAPAPAGSGQGETAMKTAGQGLRYGFRYDPMQYVQNDVSVPAALVRAQVLGTPRAGDDKIIADYVAEILAKQRPDGSFGDKSGDTGRSLDWLAVAGVGAERPEFARGYEAMMRQREAEAAAGAPGDYRQEGLVLVPVNGLRAACMTELVKRPEVRRTVRWLADHPDVWLEKTCPWGATFVLRALWHARGVEDVDAGIKAALAWVDREMNNAGCVKYWDPYAVVAAVGTVDTPEARTIMLRLLPMLLRGQEADGGWGPNKWDMQTLDAFRALKTHGLLDKLRALPPLPPDWRVVRSIPAPDGKLGWMTYQAGRLWIHNYENGEIIGVSPQDGSLAKRLQVPDVFPVGLGQWDGGLAVAQNKPKRVLKVNADSGAIEAEFPIPFVADPMCATMVGGKLWIADSWLFPGWVVDPAHPEKVPSSDPNVEWDQAFRLERLQAGTCPNGIAVLGDGVWQTDYFARVMIKSGPDGKLSDWAERPFGGWPPDIAYDGQNLWALDSPNKRICIIEKTESGAALFSRAAAQEVGGAPSANVKREGGKVVIGGLEEAKWGGYSPQQDTVIGAMTAIAQLLGPRDATYDYVSGVSGSAFRVQIGAEAWRIEAPFATVGIDLSQPAAAALGWTLNWMRVDPKDAAAVRTRNDAVVRSIDAGWPVLLAREECSIIVGYDEGGKSFIIRQVGAGQPGYAPLKEELVSWHAVGIIELAGQAAPSRRAAVLKSLSLASALWQMPDTRGFAEGKRAYDIWTQRLEDDAAYADAKKAGTACECNGYAYCCLDTARAAAAGYLASAAAEFDGEAADHVRKAAALYQQVVDTLRKKRDDLPQPWMLFPWDLDRIGGWTPAHRHAQARVLREVAALEEKAAAELALALKAEGVKPSQAASAALPDYAKLSLKGSGHTQDSFALTIQAADRMLGRETDYGDVYALSSNCFGPAVNLGEDCTSWWHVYGDSQCREMDVVATAVGLRVEKLPVVGYNGPDEPGPTEAYQTQRAATIRAALDSGAVVITQHGWEVSNQQGFAPWCWWGIITSAKPGDRGLLGACLAADPGQAHGYVDRVVWPHSAWALHPADTSLNRRVAVLTALANAVKRVRGTGAFAPEGDYRYGLEAMDAWIARMEKVPVCEPCFKSDPSRVWSCALDNGQTTTAASQAAATWLRKSAGSLSDAARSRMEAAAAHYDRIVALLAPAVTGVGGESYQQFIGDLAKQKAHADVLRQVKAELASAADEMGAALTAEGVPVQQMTTATSTTTTDTVRTNMAAKVKREGDRVTIEGLPAMSWGSSCDTAFAGAMEAALAVTDHPYTATQIMGYTGLAFRVRWAADPEHTTPGWCPSIPVGEFGEEQAAVAKATGWSFRIINEMDNEKDAQMGRYADEISATVEAGRPVVGYPDKADLNPAVAYGYEGAGADRKFRWLTYSSGKDGKLIAAADTGPWVMVLQGFAGAPDARRRLLDALTIAVRNWRRGTSLHPNGYPYAWGESALAAWQKDLGRAATFTEEQQKQLFFVNWWNYEIWQDARGRAAAFLKDEAPLLGADGRAAMLRAAALYEQEAKLLVDQIGRADAFLGPWQGKGFADWTPAVRTREQQVLADALALERQAVAEIQSALRAEGVAAAPEPAAGPRTTLAAGVKRQGSKVWIDMPAVGKGEGNGAGRGLEVILGYLGTSADYDTLMGDLGLAFVMQATDQGPRISGALDAGWWPLDPVTATTYLDFVSRTVGRQIEYVGGMEEYGRDIERFYNEKARSVLEASINAGRPVLSEPDFWQVVTAYDDGNPPVFSFCPRGDANQQVGRMTSTPWALITVGEPVERMDRPKADLEALKHAVALGRDQVKLPGGYVTGQKAFAVWAAALRDTKNLGENFWHSNVVRQLRNNRQCAVAYLRAMAARQPAEAAKHLSGAANLYATTLTDLATADTSKEALTSVDGRERLARLAEKIAGQEAQAVGEMEAALVAAGVVVPEGLDHAGARAASSVRREGGKVWIEGMEEINWGGSFFAREDSQARCLVEALRCAGQDVTYADVMGLSGAAFKLTMAPNLFVAEIHSEMGMDWRKIVSRVWGLDYESSDEEKPEWREHLHEAAVESIGRGMPLFYMDGEWNLLVGYHEDGSAYICKPYAGDKMGYTESKFPRGLMEDAWFVSVLRPAGKPAAQRDSVLNSLRAAVEMASRPAKADGSRLYGFAAYEAWIAALETDRKDASKHGNAFSYSQLLTSRQAAAECLRKVADELGAGAASHLRTAADRYEAIAKHLDAGKDCVMWPWEQSWTPENRAKEAATLRQCLADERVALTEIEAALAAEGIVVPPAAQGDGGAGLPGIGLSSVQAPDKVWSSSLPRAMAVALKQAGTEVSFSDMVAGSGWAFGFDYNYGNWHVAALSVDQFSWLPEQTGYRFDSVGCADRDRVWQFIKSHLDAGTPVVTSLGDGGIITACREKDGKREFLFDGVPGGGWRDVGATHPLDRCAVAVKAGEAKDRVQIARASLPRALRAAQQAQAALDAYLADVQDQGKDFENSKEWFGWATFERLTARGCCAAWLRSAAGGVGGDARRPLLAAADAYDRAFQKYAEYDALVRAAGASGKSMKETLRTPKQIAALSAALKAGIADERGAVAQLAAAVAAAGGSTATVSAEAGGRPHAGVMLDKLVARPRWVTHMGSIGGGLDFLGRKVSDGWLYGATGYAFALNIHRGLCPSAPHTWTEDGQARLGRNAGYTMQTVANASKEDHAEKQRLAWDMVRAALDEGAPCFAYDIEVGDYFVVHGYDETGYYYRALGSNQSRGPLAWDKLGTTGNVGIVLATSLRLSEPAGDRQAVMDALRFAVAMQRKGAALPASADYMPGIAGYDWWMVALERAPRVGADGPDGVNPHGASFNAQFWAECRRNAVEFLKEAKDRLKDEKLDPLFDEAAADYQTVADNLGEVARMLPMDGQWGPRLKDEALCARAVTALKAAREAEARGLLVLARIAGERLTAADLADRQPVPVASLQDGNGSAEASAKPTPPTPARTVLGGVRKVAYHTDKWRFTPFCNALDACLQYLGEPEQYDYLMCTSGAAFRMKWAPKAWDGGNSDILGMAAETLEPMRRAFQSAGYQMVPVGKADTGDWAEHLLHDAALRLGGELTDEAGFRSRIVQSINNGRPVIAFGIIGPPEACVITGYDERGDVLLGWNVFQDDEKAETEPSGYFRMRDWYGKTRGLLLIGEKLGRPDAKELDTVTLEWALQVLRTQQVRKSAAGPAAFDAWAADMLNDEYFPKDKINVLSGRLECHYDSMTVTAFRGGGSVTAYLTAVAGRQPAMAEQLKAAADCLENEDVVHGVAPWEKAQMARLADPAVRRQVADSILHARDMHIAAADHIEKALLAAGVPPEDIPAARPSAGEPASL